MGKHIAPEIKNTIKILICIVILMEAFSYLSKTDHLSSKVLSMKKIGDRTWMRIKKLQF